jgi:type I restriction enzyme M protein
MPGFSEKRLNIYEEYIDSVAQSTDTSHGDDVFPSFRETVAVDDGYREADYVIEITIDNERTTKLVLMSSKVEDDERISVENIEDEEALKRARRYSAEIESGSYYGITDGEQVKVVALDPDNDLELENSIQDLGEVLNQVIIEERRIKDSNEFVDELRAHHEEMQPHTKSILKEKIEKDEDFEERIRNFLVPIGESYDEDEEMPETTLDMLAQQGTYLLIDKILFYYLIRENEENLKESLGSDKYDEVFEQLKENPPSPEEIDEEWAQEFWDYLQEIFGLIQEIDYEPIFDPENSPLNEITFESSPYACLQLKELMDSLYKKEELSNLFDGPLLSKIYEGLIPPEIRWKWGQIYTPPEITRLITDWSIQSPEDEILDPACGTGRFLISAYEELADLKEVEIGERHQEIIEQVHGIDINQFPAHLATMSLVAMSLDSITEEVNIDVRDFFRFHGEGQTNFAPDKSKIELTGQSTMNKEGRMEGQGKLNFGSSVGKMDAIVMNPPYTRSQALGDEYKEFIRSNSLKVDDKSVKMDSKSAFYSYFVTHGTKFLRDKGRFGMIIQNSWLDVGYGEDLQDFMLDNYKLKAVIGTESDRMIKTAEVNTVIVLLEKEDSEEKRNNNLTRFVQLKEPIEWFEKNYGLNELLTLIEESEELVNEDLRILSKKQEQLYDDNKWGKYLRAPDIYFDIEESDSFVELSEFASVSSGTKTGVNEFFYFPNKHHSIDDEGSNYRIFNDEREFNLPEDNIGLVLKDIPKESAVFLSKEDLDVPNSLKYILEAENRDKEEVDSYVSWGESHDPTQCENCSGKRKKTFDKSPPWSGRKNKWYDVSESLVRADMVVRENINDRYIVTLLDDKYAIDWTFYGVNLDDDLEDDKYRKALAAVLNSTLAYLQIELAGRTNYGEGALQVRVYEYEGINTLDLRELEEKEVEELAKRFESLKDGERGSVYEELEADNPEEISLSEVKDDRRSLDKYIFEEIMELDKREQLEVYRGLIDLVRNRQDKSEG